MKKLESDPDLEMGQIIVVLFTQSTYLKSGIHFKISCHFPVFTWITCVIKNRKYIKVNLMMFTSVWYHF
jgi:hypothetical protein